VLSHPGTDGAGATRVLVVSTTAFTLMFAVWMMFGVLGIPIRKEFGLSDVQFGWLTAAAILNGSVWRLLFGIWTDRYGGRVMLTLLLALTAIPAFLVSAARSFPALLAAAFLVGMAGNSFSIGIAWNSAWAPRERQGLALGIFGAGNVGASVTKFIGPWLIVAVPAAGLFGGLTPGGWRFVPFLYGVLCLLMALATWFLVPRHDHRPGVGRRPAELLRPLRLARVWRFSLYYVVVFGAYVALAVWLPKYYMDVFGLALNDAALLTALFIFPASLLRPLGGWLSDRMGARRLMYAVLGVMSAAFLLLAAPSGHVVFEVPEHVAPGGRIEAFHFAMTPLLFTLLIFVVGCGMGVGKAAVYKYIPEYFPHDVGAVGGLVGLLGALGGFFLPLLFAYTVRLTRIPQTTFVILFLVTMASLAWLHHVVWRMHRAAAPALAGRIEPRPDASPAVGS
jgi:NNP family nitrate/nitrite transporter-like MFS transporter